MLTQDAPPESDIYHAGVYPYPYAADAYFMFPLTCHHFTPSESLIKNDDLNDCQFCTSRDGIHWMRYDQRPYIGRGVPGTDANDQGQIHGSPYVIRRGPELCRYYGGGPGPTTSIAACPRRCGATVPIGRAAGAARRCSG